MSAYGHAIEREHSAQSPSSGEESDTGSEFRMESVIYMSSLAATIFVGALVTVGVLLITLLIALMVMLQSCESRTSGAVEKLKSIDLYQYDSCKTAYLHAEINNFESYYLPNFCKDLAIKYVKDGHYANDLNFTVSLVEDYFKNVTSILGGQDLVLIDIDDLLHLGSFYGFDDYGYDDYVKEAKRLKNVFLMQIYVKLRSSGWPLVLLSRESEKKRGVIIEKLIAARVGGWFKLILRSDDDMKMETREYFYKQMAGMQAEGHHIRAVISSRMDAFVGPFVKTRIFKLPNPFITPSMIVTPKVKQSVTVVY